MKMIDITHELLASNCFVNCYPHRFRDFHDHAGIEIFYVLQGSTTHLLKYADGSKDQYTIQKGDYCIVDFGNFHGFLDCSPDFTVINFLFTPLLIQKHASATESFDIMIGYSPFNIDTATFSDSPTHGIFHDSNGEILNIFQRALKVYQAQKFGYQELLRCFAIELILQSLQPLICNMSARKKTNKIILEICDYIAIHYAEQITLERICRERFFSVPYISKLFKKNIGVSFAAYLQEIRMYNACRLLVETQLPIDRISDSVGYSNKSAFRRIFFKYTGQKPSDYRKLHSNNITKAE